jgi:thiol-disulfide isomerase/thioredoxin
MSALREMHLPSLGGATEWINSPPLTPEGLRGKVVLTDFWTYTCVNWLRTFPYVRAWASAYGADGLVVIGVHTPEFSFEHDLDNVRRETAAFGVEYPVAVDSDYAVWQAFDNHYWPAIYLADQEGVIRYRHFGEGAYEETEREIQALLGVDRPPVSVDPGGLEVAADWETLGSPETYLGYGRGERRAEEPADRLRLNEWTLKGDWTTESELVRLERAGGSIVYRFRARDVNLVLAPPARGSTVRFRVRVDGGPPRDARGGDVDAEGNGAVSESRLYQLVRGGTGVDGQRTFEIEFLDAGVEAFVFTFG